MLSYDPASILELPRTTGSPLLPGGALANDPAIVAAWKGTLWHAAVGPQALAAGDAWGALYVQNNSTSKNILVSDIMVWASPFVSVEHSVWAHWGISVANDATFDPVVVAALGSWGATLPLADQPPVLAGVVILSANIAASWAAGTVGVITPANFSLSTPYLLSWILPPGTHVGLEVRNDSGAVAFNANIQARIIEV